MERGTLFQLRNAINRQNVTQYCKNDVNASEDFFELVVKGHMLVAVMDTLGMSATDDAPSSQSMPHDAWMLTDEERKSSLMEVTEQVVNTHFDLSVQFADKDNIDTNSDTVYSYASEIFSLGLLYLELKDAIKEGDGNRVFRVWKFLFLIFRAAKRTNYAIEAFTLLSQYHLILPPRLAEKLKWSRFINLHGLPSHNISCDLHMEHLNRVAKTAVEGLGANKSKKAIIRVGKAVGTLSTLLENFDKQHHVSVPSGHHSKKSISKDLKEILRILQNQEVFKQKEGRRHKSFCKLQRNIIRQIREVDLKDWMIQRFATMVVKL